MKKLMTFLTVSLFLTQAHAGLLFNYSQLALKDLDQMNKMVRSKINEAEKAGGNQVIPLKEALQAVFSRPNEDFMIEKIISPLKTELEEHDAWESSITALVKEATGALKNPKPFSPVVQATYIVFLENIISEMKPKLNESFENKIVTQIRDAKIVLTKAAENERRLRMMKGSTSPSALAESILKEYEEQKKNQPAPAAPATEAAPAKTDS